MLPSPLPLLITVLLAAAILADTLQAATAQQPQQRRYLQCTKGCGQEIYFDANNKSQSGKFIPLDKDTGLPHQYGQHINSQRSTLSCRLDITVK
jgi:hypothetical protein